MAAILWRDLETGALDHCVLLQVTGGLHLTGTVLTPAFATPLEVSYRVEADELGRTRVVHLTLDDGGGPTDHILLADGAGRWGWEDGTELDDVTGALDVDLTVTPATNTLPIRRLAALEVGQAADLRMAWVQFPNLEVIPSAQRYRRLAPDRWHFSAGDFQAELRVDPAGLVLDYQGLFRSLAYRPD